jgi:16S rRNA (adenine1518-N6/adenine1519-N6)-dimethyltransferase
MEGFFMAVAVRGTRTTAFSSSILVHASFRRLTNHFYRCWCFHQQHLQLAMVRVLTNHNNEPPHSVTFALMYTLKKSLGQHFLKDENISRKIISELEPVSQLLEVGPGGGALTKYLVNLENTSFKAVEFDFEKVNYLLKTYPALQGKIIQGDFLSVDKPFNGPFAIVGNFPYNISTQILFRILEWKEDVLYAVGMFQKEVAQRIASAEGNKVYGVLSVLVQAFFEVEYLFDVNEQSFNPPPKVKSGVIRLRPVKTKLAMKSEADFFLLVKTAFNQRRKTLRNAVKALFDQEVLEDKLFDKRAEQLTVQQFADLSFKMR